MRGGNKDRVFSVGQGCDWTRGGEGRGEVKGGNKERGSGGTRGSVTGREGERHPLFRCEMYSIIIRFCTWGWRGYGSALAHHRGTAVGSSGGGDRVGW